MIPIRKRVCITSAGFGGVGGLSQNADNAESLEGSGGDLIQNADTMGGLMKRTNIVVKYLKLTLN